MNRLPVPNRIRPQFHFEGFPSPQAEELFIRYLKSHPDYGKTLRFITRDDELAIEIDPCWVHDIIFYKDYIVSLYCSGKNIKIVAEKVTQETLSKKYLEYKELLVGIREECRKILIKRTCHIRNEEQANLRSYLERCRKNKLEIKAELLRLGVSVKRGTRIGTLLSLGYLPEKRSV